jgi:sterol desaturase/sphingolipid hydroxylase (fatty acid hydroxylase superfamily)
MIDWFVGLFASLHQHVFETGVLPALYALGLGGEAERAFDATEIFLIGAIEVTFLAIVLGALEKWRPAETQTHVEWKSTDMLYTMLHRLGFIPLLLFFTLVPLVDGLNGWLRLHDIIPPNVEDLLPWLQAHPLVSFFFYLVLLDFVAYWLHRWQHQWKWWWSLHALHHSQREMSFWSDDRNHLLDDLLVDGIHALVAIAIGVPPAQFITLIVASRMIESLSHANLRVSFGRWGERLLVSPRFHRVHHAIGLGHEGRARGHNFAVLFPVWDVLFGTANFERVYPATGIRDQLTGRDYGDTFWRQQWLGVKRLVGVNV